jgi:4-hydroxybenzoate polyprenyltransferase
VRFKSIPIVDMISHILCLGVLQFFTVYLTFKSFDLFLIPFLMIIIPFSLMVEIFYELKDYNVDKKTSIQNTVQKFGRFNVRRLLFTSGVIVIIGFIIICLNIPSERMIVILLGSICLGVIIIPRITRFLKSCC